MGKCLLAAICRELCLTATMQRMAVRYGPSCLHSISPNAHSLITLLPATAGQCTHRRLVSIQPSRSYWVGESKKKGSKNLIISTTQQKNFRSVCSRAIKQGHQVGRCWPRRRSTASPAPALPPTSPTPAEQSQPLCPRFRTSQTTLLCELLGLLLPQVLVHSSFDSH